MNCKEVRNQIDNNGAGQAQMRDPSLLEHIEQCELCRQAYSDKQLQQRLSNIAVPSPHTDFVQNSIASAIYQTQHRSRQPLFGAIAATLMLSIGIAFYSQQHDEQPVYIGNTSFQHHTKITQAETRNINVIIESDRFLANTEIRISLSNNLHLEGYAKTTTLNLESDLQPGKNVFTLPLTVSDATTQGYVDIYYQAKSETGNIRINVNQA